MSNSKFIQYDEWINELTTQAIYTIKESMYLDPTQEELIIAIIKRAGLKLLNRVLEKQLDASIKKL